MTLKKMIVMTALVAGAMSHSIMAKPMEPNTEIMNSLDNSAIAYIEDQEVPAGPALSEDVLATGILTKVVAEEAKVREAASDESDIINYLAKDDEVVVIEMIDNWYLIKTDDIEGYVYRTQLNEEPLALVPYTRTEANQLQVEEKEVVKEDTYLGEEVVIYAKQFLGNPYVYAGNSLTNGVDCSGFTTQVYKNFGISLQRSSRGQFGSNGYKVSKNDLLPGDLVFYGYDGYIDHVALYAGNGEIIHASSPKTGIKMSKLEYGKPIIGIKRVID